MKRMYLDSYLLASSGLIFIVFSLGLALATSPGNKSRLKLLTKLRDLLQKADDGPHVAWLHSQIAEALQNLKTPQLDDIELVIPLSHSHGGARFLEEWLVTIKTLASHISVHLWYL